MPAAPASSWTTPGRRRCSSRRTPMASTSRSRPAPNISPATPTCCSASSRPTRPGSSGFTTAVHLMAIPAGPEDVFLALRGLRTMELRLREAERQALALAQWLAARPEVLRVIHPALPDHPGHALWKRDFTGSSGLFSIVLKPAVGGGCRGVPRWARTVRPRLFLGRLREPRRSLRLHGHSHRDAASRPAARRCASASASRTSRISRPTSTGASSACGRRREAADDRGGRRA